MVLLSVVVVFDGSWVGGLRSRDLLFGKSISSSTLDCLGDVLRLGLLSLRNPWCSLCLVLLLVTRDVLGSRLIPWLMMMLIDLLHLLLLLLLLLRCSLLSHRQLRLCGDLA